MLDGSIISSCYNLNISRSIQRSSPQLIQYIKGTLMHHAYTCTPHGIISDSQ